MALTVAMCVPGAAYTHEFVAKPATMTVQAGAELQVAGLATHVFFVSQELEAPKDVKVGYYVDGKRNDIPVKPNDKTLTYDGTLTAPSSATFIITGARLPQKLGDDPGGTKASY
jgi:hypothetical protein